MKVTEAQKRAQNNYIIRLKKLGYERVSFIIKPEWKGKIKEVIKEIKKFKG